MSNSLGIGSCGKTYNLMPKHLINKPILNNNIKDTQNYLTKNRIENNLNYYNRTIISDESDKLGNFKTTESHIISKLNNDPNNEPNNDPNNEPNNELNNETNNEPNNEPNNETNNVVQPQQNISIEKHFDKLFLESNTIQLMGIFRKVKGFTNRSKKFQNHNLAYIDYKSMKQLIQKAKSEQSNNGVMSLKNFIKMENQDIVGFEETDDLYQKIQMLEVLGPPDTAIISLNSKQIKYLNDLGINQYYWPKGSGGILWFQSNV